MALCAALAAVGSGASYANERPSPPRPPPPAAPKPAPKPAPAPAPAALPPLPLYVYVAAESGQPVVSAEWVDEQVSRATALFAPHGLSFVTQAAASLDEAHARLETRADRDALGALTHKGVVDVFVVASLRDVDDPSLLRMGVHWRRLTDLKNRYVIVAASARRSTLAHELGHYFGNPHTSVENNLMSYVRTDEAAVFVDATQGARARQSARYQLLVKELVAAPDDAAPGGAAPGGPPAK